MKAAALHRRRPGKELDMDIRDRVESAFRNACRRREVEPPAVVHDEMILLESGLDSLGFALFVTNLEIELNYDPFVLEDTPSYPRTFGEFVAMYEKYKDHAQQSCA